MKLYTKAAGALCCGLAIWAVGGCGVGNDDAEAGSLQAFNIVPTSITLNGPNATTCGSGPAGRVFVYGGAGPYQINVTQPDIIQVSKSELKEPGDSFDVFLPTLSCMTTIPIVVVDKWGRQANVTITSARGGTTTP
jgi:hypothetical protein